MRIVVAGIVSEIVRHWRTEEKAEGKDGGRLSNQYVLKSFNAKY